jgi:hypothetical protein
VQRWCWQVGKVVRQQQGLQRAGSADSLRVVCKADRWQCTALEQWASNWGDCDCCIATGAPLRCMLSARNAHMCRLLRLMCVKQLLQMLKSTDQEECLCLLQTPALAIGLPQRYVAAFVRLHSTCESLPVPCDAGRRQAVARAQHFTTCTNLNACLRAFGWSEPCAEDCQQHADLPAHPLLPGQQAIASACFHVRPPSSLSVLGTAVPRQDRPPHQLIISAQNPRHAFVLACNARRASACLMLVNHAACCVQHMLSS